MAQANQIANQLQRALLAAGIVVDVSLGDHGNKATWVVRPASLQAAAQPIIDAFDPSDPALAIAEKDEATDQALRGVLDHVVLALAEKLPTVVAVLPGYDRRQLAESIRGRVMELQRAPNTRPKK